MKKLLSIMLLAFVVMTGQAKEKVIVWEQPTTEYGIYGDGFFNLALDVKKVELKDNETVVYITAYQRSDYPDFWFQFAGDTYLKIGEQDEQGLQARYGLPLPAAAKGYEGIRLHRG